MTISLPAPSRTSKPRPVAQAECAWRWGIDMFSCHWSGWVEGGRGFGVCFVVLQERVGARAIAGIGGCGRRVGEGDAVHRVGFAGGLGDILEDARLVERRLVGGLPLPEKDQGHPANADHGV